jgi:integrase
MKRVRAKPLKLKGIKRVTRVRASGLVEVELYHRATMTRLDPLNLVTSFAEVEKAMRTKSRGTLIDLIRLFDTSEYFKGLSQASREAYVWKLRIVEKKWGGLPIEALQDKEFRRDALAWQEEMGKTSHRSADNNLAALARVLSYAKEKSEIETNVLDTFKRLYKSDRSEMTWSDGLVGRFLERASQPMRTAMYLVRNTGQRQKDLRELPWSAYDGARISLRQSKGKQRINVPCPKELRDYLDGLPRVGVLILTTEAGVAFKKRYFNDCWREAADLAQAGELNFHDLRGTAATQLAEAGCSVSEIASLMGWTHDSAQKIIDKYVARTGRLATAAVEKLEVFRQKNTPFQK